MVLGLGFVIAGLDFVISGLGFGVWNLPYTEKRFRAQTRAEVPERGRMPTPREGLVLVDEPT